MRKGKKPWNRGKQKMSTDGSASGSPQNWTNIVIDKGKGWNRGTCVGILDRDTKDND